MGLVEQAMRSFVQVFSYACQMIGFIGLIGVGIISINIFTDKLLEEKEK